MKILGVDGSLTSSGLCVLDDTKVIDTNTIPTYDLRGVSRLVYIKKIIRGYLEAHKPDVVVVEGPAMGVKGGRVFDMGEMYGLIKMESCRVCKDVIQVAPTSMKKFITGKGNAKKPQIRDALLTKWDIDIDQEDIADATGLALFAYYTTHKRLCRSLPEEQRKALEKYEVLT